MHYVADALLGKIPPGDQSSNGHFLFLIRLSPETSMLAFVTFFQETFFSLSPKKKKKSENFSIKGSGETAEKSRIKTLERVRR